MVRTGKEYLQTLKDDRAIYINGERVQDVTSHPAFTGITHTIAGLYDLAWDESQNMTYKTEDGILANKIYMIRNYLNWFFQYWHNNCITLGEFVQSSSKGRLL